MLIIDLIKEYRLISKYKSDKRKLGAPPAEWNQGNKGVVVVVPGLNEKWVSFETLGNFLNKYGYRIVYPRQIHTRAKIEEMAGIIRKMIVDKNLDHLVFLCHSKGGIVAKYLIDNNREINKRTKRIIAIAAPWQGSVWAKIPGIKGVEQLKPGCEWIKKIESNNKNLNKIICIYPSWDNHVVPNKSLILKGTENIKIEVSGHTRILENEETKKTVLAAVNK